MKNNILLSLIMLVIGAAIGHSLMPSKPSSESSQNSADSEPEILYWVAPMDSSYRRDGPGKSPMGMDLVPVYAGENAAEKGTVSISPAIEQSMGVTVSSVTERLLSQAITVTGVVEMNEENIVHVHPRVNGWIESLNVISDGQPVTAGEPLYALYSPELVNAQEEYLLALSRNNSTLTQAAKNKLKALQLPDDVIRHLQSTKQVMQKITFAVPQSGFVSNLKIRPGFYVEPGTTMMEIANLDTVWVTADIPQRYSALINTGQQVEVKLPAYPDKYFAATVSFVYPQLNTNTRTVKARLTLENEDRAIKPNMFAAVTFNFNSQQPVLSIPRSALIRVAQGERVVRSLGDGQFLSVPIRVGRITSEYAEVIEGLSEGDKVVTNGQFLIDSESAVDADLERLSADTDADDSDFPTATVEGVINSIDAQQRIINISRQAIEKWDRGPATMDFLIDTGVMVHTLSAGQSVMFTFEIRDGDFVVTGIAPVMDSQSESRMNMSEGMDHSGHGGL